MSLLVKGALERGAGVKCTSIESKWIGCNQETMCIVEVFKNLSEQDEIGLGVLFCISTVPMPRGIIFRLDIDFIK